MQENPWKTLGVAPTASPAEIKKAYRRLSALHHPDKGGDKDKFDAATKAYDLLSDPRKRREFMKATGDKAITKLSASVHEVVDEFWNRVTGTTRQKPSTEPSTPASKS